MFFPALRTQWCSRKPHRSFSCRPFFDTLEDRCLPTTLVALESVTPQQLTSQQLVVFDSATPGTFTRVIPISGFQQGDVLVDIKFRPATGGLYALGGNLNGNAFSFVSGPNSTLRLYRVNLGTGAATLVSPSAGISVGNQATFSADFDPFTDQLRVIGSDGENFRVSPTTGTVVGTDTNLTNSITTTGVTTISYTPGVGGAAGSTLFGIEGGSGSSLVMIGSPDGSPLSAGQGTVTTVGSLNDFFDYFSGLEVAPNSTTAFAVENHLKAVLPPFEPQLVTINLATGAVTAVGSIGDTSFAVVTSLTAVPTAPFTPPPAVTLTGNQLFVSGVFAALLGRDPDNTDLTTLAGFLDQGLISRLQFVLFVEHSPEFLGRVVNQDYLTILGRTADTGGLNAGVLFLEAGGSNDELRALLFGSPEYFQKVGGTSTSFVGALFQGATGQGIDANTQNILNGVLNAGVSRTALALILLETPAAAQQQVTRFFERYLGRAPGAAELAAHAGLVEAGGAGLDLALILASQEFVNDLTV